MDEKKGVDLDIQEIEHRCIPRGYTNCAEEINPPEADYTIICRESDAINNISTCGMDELAPGLSRISRFN